jgi:hypothetical protein
VSLPEFFVVGYRQRRVLFPLSSGNYSRNQLFASNIDFRAIFMAKYRAKTLFVKLKLTTFFQIFSIFSPPPKKKIGLAFFKRNFVKQGINENHV